jgi:hypothetical protein
MFTAREIGRTPVLTSGGPAQRHLAVPLDYATAAKGQGWDGTQPQTNRVDPPRLRQLWERHAGTRAPMPSSIGLLPTRLVRRRE